MKTLKHALLLSAAVTTALSSMPVEAQTQRALERRAERNARQLQRQANRADYYSAGTWQDLNPWIRQNGVAPLARAANAIGQTVDAATRIGDGQFGYRDKTAQNTWFYDYYTYTPTYYTQPTEGRYAGAIRYFDADNDGVYDSRSYYRDSDADGRYDEYDRYDFYSSGNDDASVQVEVDTTAGDERRNADARNRDTRANHARDTYRGPEDARRHNVQGEIAFVKKAEVNGNENLLVGIQEENERTLAIDLGPADALRGKHVEVGSMIEVVGVFETIGEKQLLIADSFQVEGGQMFEVDRAAGLNLTGEIVDIKSTPIGSADHYIAVVSIDGERQLVDLGPTSTYKFKIEPATKVTLRGFPVRAAEHRVILAEQVQIAGQTFDIQTLSTSNNR
ncbi:secreted protein [Rhodopirellula maiorica SM1]|uniref:Secreted protein n=1 Tax=Rhodopirellula maiorica SM1 TaxID=1265738 RepID=M5S137_9BACT|nr:hypothetical protein [Rhodopirellula maiorica]EMI19884.1 secreted protein [Rhodopirellula maiorica SM1]